MSPTTHSARLYFPTLMAYYLPVWLWKFTMNRKTVNETGVHEAIKRAGGQRRLGELVGASQQAVAKWARKGWMPVGRVIEVEQVTGVKRDRLVKPQLANLLADPSTI